MGQTLTHGVYLPDEGERNCYSGLAANWNILDGAVGTVAEHTTQIAGKAPAVHTHTKADITDLFNSANEWTGINTYTTALRFSAANYSAGTPSSDIFYGSLQWGGIVNNSFVQSFGINNAIRTNGTNDISLRVWSQTGSILRGVTVGTNADASNSSLRPLVNNVTDLGSSIYQWNNLYAKNYYYNGVAWGLDKVNTWTAQQKIVGNNSRGTISIYNPAYTKGSTLSSTDLSIGSIYMGDGGQQGLANSLSFISTDLAANGAKTLLSLSAMENTASSGTRTNVVIQYDKNDVDNPKKMSVGGALIPNPDATFPLGTPSFRWKTLNGINPGALSLPDYNRFEPIDFSQWDVNLGWGNTYTPSEDGWLYAEIVDTATNSIYVYSATIQPVQNVNRKYGVSAQGNGSQQTGYDGGLAVMIPVRKDIQYRFLIKASAVSDIYAVIFYPCLGNV